MAAAAVVVVAEVVVVVSAASAPTATLTRIQTETANHSKQLVYVTKPSSSELIV